MGDVGFIWKNQDILNAFKRSGMRLLKESELLDGMSLAMQRSPQAGPVTKRNDLQGAYCNPSQIILGFCTATPISAPTTRVVWKHDIRASIYHNMDSQVDGAAKAATKQDGIAALLAECASRHAVLAEESTVITIAEAVASALANFLIKDVDSFKLEQSPEQIGLDSLVAMELRNWIRSKFSVDTNVINIFQATSLLDLANNIRQSLIERFEGEE